MTPESELRRCQRRITLVCAVACAAGGGASAQASVPADTLTLSALLSRVTTQHPLLDAAMARVAAARGTVRTAGALPNPVLNYAVEGARFPGERRAVMMLPTDAIQQLGNRTVVFIARADTKGGARFDWARWSAHGGRC